MKPSFLFHVLGWLVACCHNVGLERTYRQCCPQCLVLLTHRRRQHNCFVAATKMAGVDVHPHPPSSTTRMMVYRQGRSFLTAMYNLGNGLESELVLCCLLLLMDESSFGLSWSNVSTSSLLQSPSHCPLYSHFGMIFRRSVCIESRQSAI